MKMIDLEIAEILTDWTDGPWILLWENSYKNDPKSARRPAVILLSDLILNSEIPIEKAFFNVVFIFTKYLLERCF